MADFTVDDDDDRLCSLCMEKFKKPKLLPCRHSFCESCLNDYILSISQRVSGTLTSFLCPYCRAEIKPPGSKLNIQEWSKTFPDDSDLEKVGKASFCKSCKEQGNECSVAAYFCLDCEEHLCGACNKVHQSLKISKGHTVRIIEKHASTLKVDALQCCENSSKKSQNIGPSMQYFCKDHGKSCCEFCCVLQHQDCENVEKISVLAGEAGFMGKARDALDELEQIQIDLNSIRQTLEENTSRIHTACAQIKENLTKFQEKIMKSIAFFSARAISKVSYEHEREHERIEHDLTWIMEKQNMVSALHAQLEIAWTNKQKEDLFLTYQDVLKHLSNLRFDLYDELGNMYESNISFVPNTDTQDLCQRLELREVLISKEKRVLQLSSDIVRSQKYKLQHLFNVNEVSECVCTVLFIEKDKLLLLDFDHKSLKLIDSGGKLVFETSIDGSPEFMTRIDSRRIAVTDSENSNILFYDVADEIKLLSSIEGASDMMGIAYLNGVFFLACKDFLCVLDQNGGRIQYLDKSSRGEVLFSEIKFIYSDPLDQRVYVSDYKKSRVLGFVVLCATKLLQQDPVFTYSHPDLSGPTGMVVDKAGNLLVCGYGSDNIHLVDRQGNHLRILLREITHPRCMEWSCDGKILVISSASDNPVECFQKVF